MASLTVMTRSRRERLLTVRNMVMGWLPVALGAVCIAVKETGELGTRTSEEFSGVDRGPVVSEGLGPCHEVVEDLGEHGLVLLARREVGEALEVVGEREGDLGADVGHLQRRDDGTQLLDGADAAVDAVRDEGGRLVVPLEAMTMAMRVMRVLRSWWPRLIRPSA